MFMQRYLFSPYFENRRPLFSSLTKFVLLILFLAALNFANRFYYFVFIAFALLLFGNSKGFRVGYGVIPLALFSISLLLGEVQTSFSITSILKCFTYTFCYIIGDHLFTAFDDMRRQERIVKRVCLILSSGLFLHLLLNFIINQGSVARNTRDFWTDDIVAATGQAALGCMMIGVAIALLFSRNSRGQKLFSVVALMIVLYYNLILAGRSLIMISIIVAVVAGVYYWRKAPYRGNSSKIVIGIVLLLIAIFVVYNQNLFGIKDTIEDSNFYQRFFGEDSASFSEDTRIETKLEYIKYLTVYWRGGGWIRYIVGGYAHDLYFDTYSQFGVFAFIFIIVISIGSLRKLQKVMKSRFVSFETKQLLLCLYTAIHLEFWIEPIMIGMPWLLAVFCVLHGMISHFSETV